MHTYSPAIIILIVFLQLLWNLYPMPIIERPFHVSVKELRKLQALFVQKICCGSIYPWFKFYFIIFLFVLNSLSYITIP